ncbi:MAG: ABC transporter permease [Candidatus Izemoplasmatales bacterium]|nr:ABC transporter permease [Candidatus Izemoplasmatales bacterium]
MLKYIMKRVVLIAVSMLAVLALTYMILTVSMILKWTRLSFSETVVIAWNNFKVYFLNIVRDWNFGTSMRGVDVWQLIGRKLLISLKYNFTSLFIYVPLGVFLGVVAAVKRNRIADMLISAFAMVFNAIPSFIVIFFLVMYIGYKWDLVVPQEPYYSAPFLKQLEGMIIPVTALSIGPIGKFAQMVRGEIIENLNTDHFILLRAKGLTRRQAIYRHALKDSLVSVIPQIIPTFVFVLGMSFFIESVYNIQGIANLFLDSIIMPTSMYSYLYIDINVVVAIGILLYGTIMITSLFADILLSIVDPRIRITGKKI